MEDKAIDYHQRFTKMTPEEILSWVLQQHPGKAVFSSSMGAEDQVITHMLCGITSKPSIFTLDTGRLFYETYDLIDKTNKRYGIIIKVMFPDAGQVEKMVNEKGINLFYDSVENRKLCCNVRKIEPLKRALKGNDIWITGLRSDQSLTRNGMPYAQWDAGNNILKVNPLLNWSEDQVWDYIHAHKVPYNTLHDKGYPSLGCKPCTRAIEPGEDIRAGRWWWEQPETKECGLHQSRRK
ncbi:MAG: phosphoadenylyl-sulfate reductase [Bacteroidia bacterium]|nr:MAG: phosphoadenylyl-sulfate reductase [Bacteroidia bacterium]